MRHTITALVFTLALLVGCKSRPAIWDVWPVTSAIAGASTYPITSGALVGHAFVVDDHHLVTHASVCMGDPNALTVDVHGARHAVVLEYLDGGLCLVRSPHALGNAMIIARSMPLRDRPVSTMYSRGRRVSRHEVSISWNTMRAGLPVFDGCGVVGVLAGPRVGGETGSRVVTVGELQRFLAASGVDWEREPAPPGAIDMGGHAWGGSKEDLGEGAQNYGRGGCR